MSGDEKMASGTTIADRYRVTRVLGEGGMGVVYAAEHMLMRKEVAVKVLHGEMCSMPEIVARFEREAIAAAHIEHPNVAGATDFGRLPDGACYLVLELLKGTSLRDEIAKGPLPLERALVILRGIANGVAAAHAKGIVHRDLKPENVMLVEREGMPDFVKVLDFGIAKMDAAGQAAPKEGGHNIVTRVGTIFGTPEYMAPEQAVGDKVDTRADIFALGVVFLEMLTGKCPFKGEVLHVLRERILMTSPIDMSAIQSDAVKALIAKMIQRQADDRLQTAGELLAAIDALEARAAEPVQAPPSQRSIVVKPHSEAEAEPKAAMSITTKPEVLPDGRPKWLVPAAIAASAMGLVVVVVALAASGGEPKKQAAAGATPFHGTHHGVATIAAKHAPEPKPTVAVKPTASASAEAAPSAEPSEAAEPPPSAEPSASATAEPETSAEPAPSASHNVGPATDKPWQRRRRGGGGIHIPPPSQWFK